jgi:hypothetical protein
MEAAALGVTSFLDGRGVGGKAAARRRLCCPLRLALFPPAVDFFSSASSGFLVALGFLVAAEVAVVGFLLRSSLRRLEAMLVRLPVRAQWV